MGIEQKLSDMPYDIQHIVQFKVEKCLCEDILLNLKLIMNMKCVKHILYVKVALKRIEIAKKLFIFEI